jgi:glycosyltransferase involved in cell wall biosynthesis
MKKLCFGIPTWNRGVKLERCIRTMIQQIMETNSAREVGIFVSDNCSDDSTPLVLSKLSMEFPGIVEVYRRLVHSTNGHDNFEEVFRRTPSEYIWIFGDDDVLLPGGLNTVLSVIKNNQPALIHAGHGWFKPHSLGVYGGTVISFANRMGYNQFVGWITAIILRRDVAHNMVSVPQWPTYKECAFPQTCGVLHAAAYLPAIVIDHAIVEPMEAQTREDMERWAKGNTAWRYVMLIDSMKLLFESGRLREKLKPGFFKYLNYYLWDRFIVNMIASHVSDKPWPDKGWDNILLIAEMIDDQDIAKRIRSSVYSARKLCETRTNLKAQLAGLDQCLANIANETNKPVLPLAGFLEFNKNK